MTEIMIISKRGLKDFMEGRRCTGHFEIASDSFPGEGVEEC